MTAIERRAAQPSVDPHFGSSVPLPDDTSGVGVSFSDLLAGLVKPCNGASGFLEDKAGMSLAGPSSQQQANVFNSFGLFRGVTANGSRAASEVARQAVGLPEFPRSDLIAPKGNLPGVDTRDVQGDPRPGATFVEGSTDRVGASEHLRAVAASPPHATSSKSNIASIASAVFETVDRDALPPEMPIGRAARFARALEARAAATTIDVTLHATDDGRTVIAQVGDIGQGERLKLRDRIVALLARHGLIVGSVRVDGRLNDLRSTNKGR